MLGLNGNALPTKFVAKKNNPLIIKRFLTTGGKYCCALGRISIATKVDYIAQWKINNE